MADVPSYQLPQVQGVDNWRRWSQNAMQNAEMLHDYIPWFWTDSERSAVYQDVQAQQEFERNLYMWNLENQYNSPSQQMARMKAAGINPMLAYGQVSTGNSNGMAAAPSVRPNITSRQEKFGMAMQAVNVLSSVVGTIMGMSSQAYDLRIKRNEADLSDYLNATRYRNMSGYGAGRTADVRQQFDPLGGSDYMELVNPESPYFDPTFLQAYLSSGRVPDWLYTRYRDVPKRLFDQYRADYQNTYNEKLLPLFEKFQQGKIDLQEFEKGLQEYEKSAREMIPAELRGILEPLFDWLGPLFKIIFKTSKGSFKHNVETK